MNVFYGDLKHKNSLRRGQTPKAFVYLRGAQPRRITGMVSVSK